MARRQTFLAAIWSDLWKRAMPGSVPSLRALEADGEGRNLLDFRGRSELRGRNIASAP
jgi:hypothetical protein